MAMNCIYRMGSYYIIANEESQIRLTDTFITLALFGRQEERGAWSHLLNQCPEGPKAERGPVWSLSSIEQSDEKIYYIIKDNRGDRKSLNKIRKP